MQTIELDRLSIEPDQLILDIGCGEGRHSIGLAMREGLNIHGIDQHKPSLEKAKQTQAAWQAHLKSDIHWQNENLFDLNYQPQSIDGIICSEVLEHIPQYGLALQHIKALIKPNGWLAVSVPKFWPEWICWLLSDAYHAEEGGHVHIFKIAALKDEIESLGFRCTDQHSAHALHSPYWWLKCLYWKTQNTNMTIKKYHQLLIHQMMQQPQWLNTFEKNCLNPWLGKSDVLYFQKTC